MKRIREFAKTRRFGQQEEEEEAAMADLKEAPNLREREREREREKMGKGILFALLCFFSFLSFSCMKERKERS